MEVSITYGPPGTGKTQHLLGVVEEEIRRGVPPNRIAFVSFTKRAVIEAKTRAMTRFSLKNDDLPWFRTLHSAAYKIKELRPANVMGKLHYDALAAAMGGIKFSHQYDEDTAHCYESGDDGDELLSIYAWARAVGAPAETAARHYQHNGGRIDLDTIRKFFVWLDAYKRDLSLVDFSDMLENALPVPVDVAVIDEAQDNTPQQWRAVHAMFGGVQRLHVAGDDDQAIFSWAGADMTRLLEIEGTRRVLAKSWRVPAAVYTLSAAIVSQIRTRVPKQWAPTDGEGAVLVSTIDSWHPRNVDAGSWLCLARNRRNLAEVTTRLEDLGVPYIVDGQSILDRRGVQAVLSYERLRRGESIGAEGFRKLKRHMAVSLSRDEIDDGQVSWGDITWPFAADPAARPIWLELVERRILQAPERDVMILRNIRRSGESLVANPRVVVSTIHSAKGAEADNVLLLSDTSRRTAYAARENPDDEHRVFYVGTTRAKKNLVIVPPSSKHHYSLLQ